MILRFRKSAPPLRSRKTLHPDERDGAVSPVVGVMLMLVVTIIIAAIVSSFAGGLGSTSENAPVATLAIKMFAGPNEKNVTIEHLGGDPLATKDLKIVSSFTVPETFGSDDLKENSGRLIKHTIDGSLAPIKDNAIDTGAPGYPFTPQGTNDDSVVSTRTAEKTFGTAILVSGGRLTFDRDNFLGFETEECYKYGFGEGVTVNVMIVHTGSGKVLFYKDVIVPW